jgi:hypothetical protein
VKSCPHKETENWSRANQVRESYALEHHKQFPRRAECAHLCGLMPLKGHCGGVQQSVDAVAGAPDALRSDAFNGIRKEGGDGLQRGLGGNGRQGGRGGGSRDEVGQQGRLLQSGNDKARIGDNEWDDKYSVSARRMLDQAKNNVTFRISRLKHNLASWREEASGTVSFVSSPELGLRPRTCFSMAWSMTPSAALSSSTAQASHSRSRPAHTASKVLTRRRSTALRSTVCLHKRSPGQARPTPCNTMVSNTSGNQMNPGFSSCWPFKDPQLARPL